MNRQQPGLKESRARISPYSSYSFIVDQRDDVRFYGLSDGGIFLSEKLSGNPQEDLHRRRGDAEIGGGAGRKRGNYPLVRTPRLRVSCSILLLPVSPGCFQTAS